MTRLLGIDVSHFQNTAAPAGVPWSTIAQKCSFVIVRASYGKARDGSAPEFVKRARAVGLKVGMYTFFRAVEPISAQLDAFCAQALACGYGKGDIAPAPDIEDDLTSKIDATWEPLVRAVVDGLASEFGVVMPYITQRDWHRLGAPAWVLEHPLWVANYTGAAKPATPGNVPAAIWQRSVGPYAPDGPGGAFKPYLLDQNVADGPLPLATMNPSAPNPSSVVHDVAPDNHEAIRDQRVSAAAAEVYQWREEHGLDPGTGLGDLRADRDTDPSELAPEVT